MDKSRFIHLHLHTSYSIRDGISNCEDYLKQCKKFGMNALAVTDHGNMSAHIELQLKAREFGIKPVFGAEFYIVEEATIHDKEHRKNNHLVLLARNEIGYKNLTQLQKISWSPENYYYRPRIDLKILSKHRKGLIALTACLKSLLASELLSGRLKHAYNLANKLKKLFGNHLYLEIQLHSIFEDGKDIQKEYNKQLIRLSKKLKIPLVLTNDVHYLTKSGHDVQTKIIKMKTGADLEKTYCDSIWFKSYDDLKKTWKKEHKYISKEDFNEAVKSTKIIAKKCNFEIPLGGLKIPKINLNGFPNYKEKWSEEEYLNYRIKKGLKRKIKKGLLSDKKKVYLKRIEKEMDSFRKMDVFSYILIYDDLIRFLKKQGCLCSLRGSANGSVVLWLIGLSIVDPIKFNILFERFLSPARIEAHMADIDIDLDISHTYRDLAISYLKEKYGEDHICSVGSFNRTQLRAAIKNVARVEADRLKKKIEKASGSRKKKLEKKLESFSYQEINKLTKQMSLDIEDLKQTEWYEKNKKWMKKYVIPIIGNVYSESLHPAGIVISPEPYDNWLPVRTNKLPKEKGGQRVFATQWENSHTFEEYLNEVGAMVMDILGVKTLTVISETIKLIRQRTGKKLKLDEIPLDDKKVYKSLSKGENLGFFQLGKESLRGLFKRVKPTNIEDLIFLIAADRPGPISSGAFEHYISRKHDEEKIKYPHPSLENVYSDSLGVLVYSEHVMRGSVEFAGFSPIKAEKLRKIMKSKKKEDMLKLKDEFINGAIKKWGIEVEKTAKKIWDDIIGFSLYAFPKSHSTSYALIANATQYLKVHYPIEFFCSYLQQASDDEYNSIKEISKESYNVKYIMPEINKSKEKFVIVNNKIVWSLTSIKGVGIKAADEIVSKQPFSSFEDFFKKVNKTKINIRVMKILIAANVFRKFNTRNKIYKQYAKLRKDKEVIRLSKDEWKIEASKVMKYYKQTVKELFPDKLKSVFSYSQFSEAKEGRRVIVAGFIKNFRKIQSKRGEMYLFKLEDGSKNYNIVCWNSMVKRLISENKLLKNDLPVKISGYKTLSNMNEEQVALGHEQRAYIKILKK